MTPRRLGMTIKDLRTAQGLSQKALGKRAKVTDAYITMLETGKRKSPSLAVLQRLAKALGVPVTALLE
jgi:transcriptional regulator with XRE-family HTH domain